jgi:hypothetical protein
MPMFFSDPAVIAGSSKSTIKTDIYKLVDKVMLVVGRDWPYACHAIAENRWAALAFEPVSPVKHA